MIFFNTNIFLGVASVRPCVPHITPLLNVGLGIGFGHAASPVPPFNQRGTVLFVLWAVNTGFYMGVHRNIIIKNNIVIFFNTEMWALMYS